MGTALLAALVVPIGVNPVVERVEVLTAVKSLRRLETSIRTPSPTDDLRLWQRKRLTELLKFLDQVSSQFVAGTLSEVEILNFHTTARDVMHAAEALADNPGELLNWRRDGAVLAHRVHAVVARRAANGLLDSGAERQARAQADLLREQYRILLRKLAMH